MKVLIVGEGIAGAALATSLSRRGVSATVVERVLRFEARGHMISLKGNGVSALRRMGLFDACKAREHTFDTMAMFTREGKLLRRAPSESVNIALGAYLMINRGDLAEALHDAAAGCAELRFGTTLSAVEQGADGVHVVLSDGREERYDLVVGADGVHSQTRALAFGAGLETAFGAEYLALIVHARHGVPVDEVRAYMGRGQSGVLIPRGAESAFATIYHPADDPIPRGDHAALRPWLLDRYGSFAPEFRAVLEAVGPETWHFVDAVSMVKLPSPLSGRVVLVGDAGFCPTFMSGMGASLALQSSFLLDRALAEHSEIDAALTAYAAAVQPIAARYQQSAVTMRGALLDRRWLPSVVRNAGIRWVPEALWARKAAAFYNAETASAAQM